VHGALSAIGISVPILVNTLLFMFMGLHTSAQCPSLVLWELVVGILGWRSATLTVGLLMFGLARLFSADVYDAVIVRMTSRWYAKC
jgi:hypothetical protein